MWAEVRFKVPLDYWAKLRLNRYLIMEVKECPICNLKDAAFFSQRDKYIFLKCDNCNLVFMDPLPNAKELTDNFYSKESGYHAKAVKNLKEIKKYGKKFTKVIDGLTRFKVAGNLLDVGCANGEFLFLAKKHGFDVQGAEANAYTADIAMNNGLTVFNGTLQEARFEDHYFSVIYLGDIIEHVTDPVALIKECKRILKKEGIFVVSTPNADCFWVLATQYICRWFVFPWSVLHPPYHLYLFSADNLRKLMNILDFKVLKVEYDSPSLRHELGVTGLLKKYKNEKSVKILLYAILVFSMYTIVYIISFLLKPFLKKDFEMIVFAENQ